MSFMPTVTISLSEYETLKRTEAEFRDRTRIRETLIESAGMLRPYNSPSFNDLVALRNKIIELVDRDIWK